MKSKEESIRLLKKRMHQQMNVSPEKDIKPENIQYYVSSLMMQREEMYQKESMCQEEDEIQELNAGADGEEAAGEHEEYEEMPADPEYIKKPEEFSSAMRDIKVPETMEVQHERAKNEYEKVLNAVDEEEIFGFRRPHWLNIKG